MLQKHSAITVIAEAFVNHQVFQQDDKAALRRADGKQEVDHADDDAVAAQDENAATIWLFEYQAQTAKLPLAVWTEIAFLAEKFAQQT
jgi:hypothetical protein